MIEIGSGKLRVERWQETVRAIIKTLPCNIHIIRIHYAVDKPRRHPAGNRIRACGDDFIEHLRRRCSVRIEMRNAIGGKPLQRIAVLEKGMALKCPETDMTMREARQHGCACRRRLVMARQRFVRFYERKSAARIHAHALQI